MPVAPFQHFPSGSLLFGPGVSQKVGATGPLKKANKIVVISDAGVARAGVLAKVTAALDGRIALQETGVMADGDVAWTDALAARAKAAGVDGILAIGGGSVLDTAKGLGAVLATGKPLEELEGIMTVRAKLPPFAAVPTTSGTGSEASQFAVLKDVTAGRKRIFMDSALLPQQCFLDPELLVGLPMHVTAATGVDALTHAIEALGSKMRNPIGTALALEAVRMLVVDRALERALKAPEDIAARGECLMAAHLAGQAINTSMLGACHALAHALGAKTGVPHGVANGVFLTAVMEVNLEKAEKSYALLASTLGVSDARAAIAEVARVVHDLAGIPRKLSELGVTRGELAGLAALAAADPDLPTNPVALDEARVLAICEARL
jgi:alcohol dehydrogenase class IV